MRFERVVLAAGILVSATACDDSVTVGNASPKGSVGGLIVDAASRMAIGGASITLYAGGRVFAPEVTEADGSFAFNDVPAGTLLLVITPSEGDTHWGASVNALLTGDAGMFPQGNEALTLTIGLIPAASPFRFRVLDEQGAPVAAYNVGVETTFEYVDWSNGYADARGERHYAVQTDGDGYATAASMPDYWRLGLAVNDAVFVSLPPYDANMDNQYEFAGGMRVFNMLSLADPTPDIILDPNYETTLYVVASTIGQLEGGVGGTPEPALISPPEDLYVKFNLPIEDGSIDVVVSNEDGVPIMPAATATVVDDTLSISLPTLTAGAEYNVAIHVVTSVGDRIIQGDFGAPFFVQNPSPTVTIQAITREPSGAIRVRFSEPVGTGNPGWNTLWGADCVLFFNADLNMAGGIGDSAGETGNPNCEGGRQFYAVEPDPVGTVGLSGYASVWEFYPPAPGGTPLGAGVATQLRFSHVANAVYHLERADGRLVDDLDTSLP